MEQKKLKLWKALEEHAHSIRLHLPSHLMPTVPKQKFNASFSSIHLDYSHQHLTEQTLELLFNLAETCQLREKIEALMHGGIVNVSENRPALHTALRADEKNPILVNGRDIMPDIFETRLKMKAIAEQIRAKEWLGFAGNPITDIINIGIGGSDFGPKFCLKALTDLTSKELNYHFISDADPHSFKHTIEKLRPDTTLFIISSKSFSTQETLYNTQKAMDWIGSPQYYNRHFIAVTAHSDRAKTFGIHNVLSTWDWVGGRYSFCSAINLIGAIALGYEQFSQILAGANQMDRHFRESDFANNLPVLLALLGIWNNNFLHINNLLFLTYSQRLDFFVPYVQQLDMESNGKSIDLQAKSVHYATGPLVWGGSGNQAQHSYYQLLCQGTHKVTVDFISVSAFNHEMINEMCEAKINLLTQGVKSEDNPNGYIPGNIPLNHLSIDNHTPFSIGALIALYEHKIFAQSVIWNINPFDQPGVESARRNYKAWAQRKMAADLF